MSTSDLGEKRLANFRRVIDERGLDAILLSNFWAETSQGGDYNLYYLSNLLNRFMQCFLVLTPVDCVIWIDAEDEPRAREQSSLDNFEILKGGENWGFTADEFGYAAAQALKSLLGKQNLTVGINGRFLPSSVGLAVAREGIDLIDVGRQLEISRIVKDRNELEYMRKGAWLADLGVQKVMDSIHEGISEHDLAVLAEAEMRRYGAECFWWKTLVGSGPQAEAWPDSPSSRKITKGDLVIMDFTPIYEGYGGDIARSFVFGTPTEEQTDVFHLAEQSLEAAVDVLKEGVTCRELMEAGAKPVLGTSYENYFIGVGHGIGLYNDNYPNFLAPLPKMKVLPESVLDFGMKAGMVVAMEVIFTVPGLGGVRLEDDYVITPGGTERLTHVPTIIQVG